MNDLDQLRKQLEVFRQANLVEILITAEDGETRLPLRLRKIGIEDLVFSGKIPDSLSGIVSKILGDDEAKFDIADLDMSEMGDLFNSVLMVCTEWPPLALERDEEHLGVDEIPFAIKEAIFAWVNGEALALEPFREKPRHDEPSAQPGEDLRPSPE